MLRSILIATAAAALFVGCSHPVDSYSDKILDTGNKVCERCATELMTTVSECQADVADAAFTDTERQCLKDVESRQQSVGPYFDCANGKASDFESCMDSAGCNSVAVQSCLEIISSVNDTCPLPSADALREIAACTG